MNFFFSCKELLDSKIENELLKNEKSRPVVELAKKYGIRGMQIMSFIADLATVAQQMGQMQQKEGSE